MNLNSVCCIGAGYVGGPTMAVLAKKNPLVKFYVVDENKQRIKQWNSKDLTKLPIYEPGLSEVIDKTRNKNLFFTNEIEKYVLSSEIIFIAVNTPTKKQGKGKGYAADLTNFDKCAIRIAQISKTNKIIVEKSTVPVKTSERLKKIFNNHSESKLEFQVLSNPEFLAEGTAMRDLEVPDRVIIGGEKTIEGSKAISKLVQLYSSWVPKKNIITTNLWSSELSKLASNAFLAQRISSINSLSEICEKTGADIDELSKAIGMDSRIGDKFLKTSVGFGGSCFQKDILNLVYISESLGLNIVANYWKQVILMNNHQRTRFASKIIQKANKEKLSKKIALFGWAFKKNTNDSRESASIYVANELLKNDFIINVYDPSVERDQVFFDLVSLGVKKNLLKNVNFFTTKNSAAKGVHMIAILTEWDEFVNMNWINLYDITMHPCYIFDGRNILDYKIISEVGFKYIPIGNKY